MRNINQLQISFCICLSSNFFKTNVVCLFVYRSHERTPEELEIIYEELIHITALSHLSNTVKRELTSVIVFEAHTKAGTICESKIF